MPGRLSSGEVHSVHRAGSCRVALSAQVPARPPLRCSSAHQPRRRHILWVLWQAVVSRVRADCTRQLAVLPPKGAAQAVAGVLAPKQARGSRAAGRG